MFYHYPNKIFEQTITNGYFVTELCQTCERADGG